MFEQPPPYETSLTLSIQSQESDVQTRLNFEQQTLMITLDLIEEQLG